MTGSQDNAAETARRTRALFKWLNQVKADPDKNLPPSAFKVAFELGQYVNKEIFKAKSELVAWPSFVTVARNIGMGERTARTMAGRLKNNGHLLIESRHGPNTPNRYTLTIGQPAAVLSHAAGLPSGAEPQNQIGGQLPHLPNKKRQLETTKSDILDSESGSWLPPNHYNHTNHQASLHDLLKAAGGDVHHVPEGSELWQRWCDYLGGSPPRDRNFGFSLPRRAPWEGAA